MSLKPLSQETFDSFVGSQRPVVIEFHADWCVDCKRIEKSIPDVATTFKDTYEFASIDVEAEKEIAERFNVLGIPTFIVFQGGEEVDRLPSKFAKTKEQIVAFLEKHG